tara:strand:+ start:214 stop:1752 length:1539 start_codon:yes stop_codon:yes gene_type:complete
MSVQISYKKQTIFLIIGLLIIFSLIELIANIWWEVQIDCEFENSEIFNENENIDTRQLCLDLYNVKVLGKQILPSQQSSSITINSLGFRGEEFSLEKSDDTFRIFIVGGSTVFGHGATSDKTTIPGYLKDFFQTNMEEMNVEVINAGIQGADSFEELSIIKNKIIPLSPDLIIVYDGWNDLREQNSADELHRNWNSMCTLGENNNLDVVISLQPIAGFGGKTLTDQELKFSKIGTDYQNNVLINSLEKYDIYAKNLQNLNACSMNIDLRNIFDDQISQIYWDQGHVSDKGNYLVASALKEKIISKLPEITPKSVNSQIIEKNNEIPIQMKYLLSNYKTPLMVQNLFIFEQPSNLISEMSNSEVFTTQNKIYSEHEIFVEIQISEDPNDSNSKILEIRTINVLDSSNIPHVTYFLKISSNDQIILSDYFYVENEIFTANVVTNNSNSIEIIGERQYDHNAIIISPDAPIIISGPLLKSDEEYDFDIELRTIYDPSNWIFSLDGFHSKILLLNS